MDHHWWYGIIMSDWFQCFPDHNMYNMTNISLSKSTVVRILKTKTYQINIINCLTTLQYLSLVLVDVAYVIGVFFSIYSILAILLFINDKNENNLTLLVIIAWKRRAINIYAVVSSNSIHVRNGIISIYH